MSLESSGHGRFLPGTKVAGRYRIVSLLGKGGMGEVYRADDLTLGHAVALKFLPKDLADDPRRLEFFRREVRLSRQIAHPNVCRVYDIGEIDGHHFLSMEYIDGEDLGVLLRRIGRLPADKGVQIAQQLCAGLAAAHDKGVLHRDLKPANIMLDGRGQVRITDFGLAQLATERSPGEIAGTPAYMAPEQLTRGETTIQSDLYSLGLILYEVCTGQRVLEGRTLDELVRAHEELSPRLPSSVVEDIDPIVEQVILRCLAKEPHERPLSAHAVAAALPGGDPLAAALAAGETPSPELVAAAGDTGTLSLRTGTICLVLVLLGLIAYPYIRNLGPFGQLFGHSTGLSPAGNEPSVLQHELRQQILTPLGLFDREAPPEHSVHGLHLQRSPDGSSRMEFWYRQRNRGYLTPEVGDLWKGPPAYTVTVSNPPPYEPGMASVRVDMRGRLIELLAVPDDDAWQQKTGEKPLEDQWLFERAGLRIEDFQKIANPQQRPKNWKPPVHSDETAMYQRSGDDSSDRVVIARDRGRVVYLYAEPVTDDRFMGRQFIQGGRQSGIQRTTLSTAVLIAAIIIVLVAALILALRNVRLGRADRRGALRLALATGTLQMLAWLFAAHHVASFPRQVTLLYDIFSRSIFLAVVYWLVYLALESYVRRYWPNVLIAWTRTLNGRFRDPLVGRELLFGCMAGVGIILVTNTLNIAASQLGEQAMINVWFNPDTTLRLTAASLSKVRFALTIPIWMLMTLFLCRVVLRSEWLAIIGFSILQVAFTLYPGVPITHVINQFVFHGILAVVVTRYGLLSGMACYFASFMLWGLVTTPDVTAWYGRGTLVALGSVATLALYGYYTSTLAPRITARPETA